MLPKKDKTTEERRDQLKVKCQIPQYYFSFLSSTVDVEQTESSQHEQHKQLWNWPISFKEEPSGIHLTFCDDNQTELTQSPQWQHSSEVTLVSWHSNRQTDRQPYRQTDRQTAEQSSRYSAEEYLCARSVSSSSSWTCGGSGSSRLPWWENCPPVKP